MPIRAFRPHVVTLVLLSLASGIAGRSTIAEDSVPSPVPPMGIGLGGVSGYTSAWTFADMMKHSREWRAYGGLSVVEDEFGWPMLLQDADGNRLSINEDRTVQMWLYNRRITGQVVLTWEGDGEVVVRRAGATLIEDDYPDRSRRVYRWDDQAESVFDVVVVRSNYKDHVRNIRLWMPGQEDSDSPFHPLFKERLKPFPYLRFMDWGGTNNSEQREWSDRKDPRAMRQTKTVAYEYMIQLCNETDKDMWVCIPHLASDDYVEQLGKLIEEQLEPERKVYVEYSNEIWNPAFQQTRHLWEQAKQEGHVERPWEYGATLCGRRSAQIWAVMERQFSSPDRMRRVMAHFRWLDQAMEAALDPANGSGRVDLIALNGYFISQDALQYALRRLDSFDIDEVFDDIEQLHLLGKADSWAREMRDVRERWELPIICYEGGQHFANPFSSGLQGEALVKRMFEVNGDPRIRDIYRTALETWRLAGGQGFTAFVDCGSWSKYGCWGHLRYQNQPLEDVVDSQTGQVVEPAAYKYLALLDHIHRWQDHSPSLAPTIVTDAIPDAIAGRPYQATLEAAGGQPPYQWSVLGGRLPGGLDLRPDGVIEGVAKRPEQLVWIANVTDSAGQHGSRVMGAFMAPVDRLANTQTFQTIGANGLPAGWTFLGQGKAELVEDSQLVSPTNTPMLRTDGLAYLPSSASDDGYTVEVVCSPERPLTMYARIGLAINLTPDGDPEDYLRIAIDGTGRQVDAYSRYVAGGKGELWSRRTCWLTADEREAEGDIAFDPGEFWTIRVTVRPASSPGAIDLLVSVLDERGQSRLNPADRYDVANGIWLIRELALKQPLMSGPFGLMADGVLIDQVRWQ